MQPYGEYKTKLTIDQQIEVMAWEEELGALGAAEKLGLRVATVRRVVDNGIESSPGGGWRCSGCGYEVFYTPCVACMASGRGLYETPCYTKRVKPTVKQRLSDQERMGK